MEKKNKKLEDQITFMQQEISQMSDEIYTQQKEITQLIIEMIKIKEKLKDIENNSGINNSNEESLPPHY